MLNAETFRELGDNLTKHDNNRSRQIGMRRFRAFFGCSPQVCSTCWNLLQRPLPNGAKPIHLLWALLFLKRYETEESNRAILNSDEKTIRKWVWIFVEKISNIKVVKWENRLMHAATGQSCFVSLDGTDFRIREPTPFNKKWFSHKFHGPGLRYEVGISIRSGDIVWAHGGYPCGEWNDLSVARDHFIHQLRNGEKAMGDKGYRDNRYFITPTERNNVRHKQIMARHETVNARIKNFNVLSQRFRHSLDDHYICFHAVVNLIQMSIDSGEKLYSVT